jgi:hypothetical protein
MKQPKGLVYKAEYEPDMARMVQALRVLLDYNPQNPQGKEDGHGTGSQSRVRALHEVQSPIKQSAFDSPLSRAGVL